jgi:hypothetical protein
MKQGFFMRLSAATAMAAMPFFCHSSALAEIHFDIPYTRVSCEESCKAGGNKGLGKTKSCVHECYWHTDRWKQVCGENRYC